MAMEAQKEYFFFLKKGPKPEYLLSTYCTQEPNCSTNSASAHSRAYIKFLPQGKFKTNEFVPKSTVIPH